MNLDVSGNYNTIEKGHSQALPKRLSIRGCYSWTYGRQAIYSAAFLPPDVVFVSVG